MYHRNKVSHIYHLIRSFSLTYTFFIYCEPFPESYMFIFQGREHVTQDVRPTFLTWHAMENSIVEASFEIASIACLFNAALTLGKGA